MLYFILCGDGTVGFPEKAVYRKEAKNIVSRKKNEQRQRSCGRSMLGRQRDCLPCENTGSGGEGGVGAEEEGSWLGTDHVRTWGHLSGLKVFL